MSTLLLPDTRPSLNRVRAIVTTKWGNTGYRPIVVSSLENYYVDSAIDTDADTWQVVIGDPYGEFLDMLKRDSEVRMQLFGVGQEATNFLMTGIADEIEFDQDGSIVVTGRDLSALALDSTVPPHRYQHVRAYSVVAQQARQLGFQQTNLAKQPMVKKLEVTDGNESYWEFWYRLYRKEKMFLWTDPNGTLIGGPLNSGYGNNPTYFFGKPRQGEEARVRQSYIPVEQVAIRKSTQQRVWQVWVYGQKGDNGFREITEDPTIANWMKRPVKILQDTDAHTPASARKLGWQEIYEGKVGSLEVTITVPDPGFAIHTNRIAIVRIPEIGFSGDFYVVGVRYQGGPDGFVQEVRLRERQFALSRRTPSDPKIQNTTEAPRQQSVTDSLAEGLANTSGMPDQWAQYFVKAAKDWHGPWDYSLFLATLFAIADQETNFRNIRSNGGPGGSGIPWYPWKVDRSGPTYGEVIGDKLFPGVVDIPKMGVAIDRFKRTREDYERIFANEPGQYTGSTWAVGPMQLYSLGYKHWADDHFKPGFRDEYEGGRWNVESNIWAGARALRDKLQTSVGDTGKDADLWAGVSHYGHHYADEGPNTVPTKYAVSVKNKVYNDPGYLNNVNQSLQSARESAKAVKDNQTEPTFSDTQVTGDNELPSLAEVRKFWTSLGTGYNSVAEKRRAIVMCAMWGYYNRDDMHYAGRSTGHQGERLSDFDPPPNFPAWTDCSGFARWCYLSATAPDPGTWTSPQWNNASAKSISVAQLQPGDLIFYANPNSTSGHVVVYVGFGKIVSFGQEDGPSLYSIVGQNPYRASEIAGYRNYFGS